MKAALLVTSVSRRGAGVCESARYLARTLSAFGDPALSVFAARDAFTEADLPAWSPVVPRVFDVTGPRAISWTPGMAAALEELRPDVVHLHGLWEYPALLAARWSRRGAVVVSPHAMLVPPAMEFSTWKKRLAWRLFQEGGLSRARAILALSASEARSIRALGVEAPAFVVPNGIDLPPRATDGRSPDPPWKGSIPEGSRVLLYLGRLHPIKGLPILLDGWHRFRRGSRAAADWHLAVAGWDQEGHRRLLERMVEESAVPGVHLLGPCYGSDKEGAFRGASAFVLPSLSEGLPTAVLEAWGYSLPVLMTEACNLPEGFAACAALPVRTDAEGLAGALGTLAEMTDGEREAMGARGRELVERNFQWPVVAREVKRVYDWAAGGGAMPSSRFGGR